MMRRFICRLVSLTLLMLLGPGQAKAGIVVTAAEVGSDVVLTGNGSANLAGLTLAFSSESAPGMGPYAPFFVIGSAFAPTDQYSTLSGPANFGSGGDTVATSGTGDAFGLPTDFVNVYLMLPAGYVSGAPLSGTSTYANHSFASLGVTPGTYVWNWGTGTNADSLTLQIGATPVPEPSTLTLAALSFVTFGQLAWRKRRQAESPSTCERTQAFRKSPLMSNCEIWPPASSAIIPSLFSTSALPLPSRSPSPTVSIDNK